MVSGLMLNAVTQLFFESTEMIAWGFSLLTGLVKHIDFFF
jgi:hypothetical protein